MTILVSETVLLVDSDAEERARLGKALEDSGFQVLVCPGPSSPDYRCIGTRAGHCPLVEQADAVVLDLWSVIRVEDHPDAQAVVHAVRGLSSSAGFV